MLNYKTVEEKAAEWKLSPRHVQFLCRNKKIEGAIKHAEVWFIPSNAPSPAKNSKSGDESLNFVGTKNKIFNSAIELFMRNGFDSVSLRDIADKAGIRQSTTYNHFKSKQDILDNIYDFYCFYFLKDRPSMEDMEAALQHESPIQIIKRVRYDFDEAYEQKLSDITKIIFQRIGIDNRAKEIAKVLMVDQGVNYVEMVFDKAIASGRFVQFDTHILAIFINSIRVFTLYNWIIDPSPERMLKLLEEENILYEYAAGMVKDLSADEAGHKPEEGERVPGAGPVL